jgi:hypothetical protein
VAVSFAQIDVTGADRDGDAMPPWGSDIVMFSPLSGP